MQQKKVWKTPSLKHHDVEDTLSGPQGGQAEDETYNTPLVS